MTYKVKYYICPSKHDQKFHIKRKRTWLGFFSSVDYLHTTHGYISFPTGTKPTICLNSHEWMSFEFASHYRSFSDALTIMNQLTTKEKIQKEFEANYSCIEYPT